MSHVLDDATSAAHDAMLDTMSDDVMLDTMHDDAMLDTMPDDAMLDTMPDDAMLDTMPDDAMLDTMHDTALPLGAFLDAQIARVASSCDDTSETADTIEVEPSILPARTSSPRPELPVMPEHYVMEGEIVEDFLACKDRYDVEKLLRKWKEKSLNARMKYDPKFATSPIFVTDKDYEFSVDPELITLVEFDPFHGYESETVVAHLTKLHDITTLFTSEEKIRHYYILKLFPFSLKDDAKTWFASLAPRCVRSPQDMVYYFSEKYFPAHKKQAALQKIYNFAQVKKRVSHKLGEAHPANQCFMDHPLEKNEILDIFYNGLTDASKDHLDSCAGCVFREQTVEQAEILLNNILCNENAWTITIENSFCHLPLLSRHWLPSATRNQATKSRLMPKVLFAIRRKEVFYSPVLKICKKPRNLCERKALNLKM
ncbi:hypothetical protein ZWY2020_018477 [Hordeum vulgare]|nr:hypothetical protein ZWY2020_018477 [Hordeum vulgare]